MSEVNVIQSFELYNYVIVAMESAQLQARGVVVEYEANGGFLLGSMGCVKGGVGGSAYP